jgi:DNA sulfur modification protein DndD
MIPISVRFSAFGPYVEEQTVDFTKFQPSGLVLIHGETGAGKTVLLDAVTFALYGRSSGACGAILPPCDAFRPAACADDGGVPL